MAFAYYNRLSPEQKRIYRESDRIATIRLPHPGDLRPLVSELAGALEKKDHRETEKLSRQLLQGLARDLKIPLLKVQVLAVRPNNPDYELHGIYFPAEGRKLASIILWMRTAQRHQVVAFRTFLRTLLHEFCHHLDYEMLNLPDSFHTEGFYKRISSLFHQLVQADAE